SSAVIAGATQSARQWGLAHQLLSAKEIRQRFPAFAPRPDEVGLYEPEAGALNPEASVLTHLDLAVRAGAEVRFGQPVLEWRALSGGGVAVTTAEGEFTAERLVITAGAWLGQLAPEIGLPLQVERNVMHWFEPLASATDLPVFIVERPDVPLFYGFPDLGGHGPKAALHHSHVLTTPSEIDRTVAPGEGDELQRVVADWMPEVIGSVKRSAACIYTNTPDEHFVIGRHPVHEQVVIAGGFSGHGFKFVSVVGEILADLATAGSTSLPIGLFDPSRFRRT
ncbi:MAG TPA: N-methyl-L-tryptophan oxidase, partial [Symbiobacteriaceae bacterium]|nr:N-methyl-L-tryptophan oxidase [Symbiobacteriaceae bacterium]